MSTPASPTRSRAAEHADLPMKSDRAYDRRLPPRQFLSGSAARQGSSRRHGRHDARRRRAVGFLRPARRFRRRRGRCWPCRRLALPAGRGVLVERSAGDGGIRRADPGARKNGIFETVSQCLQPMWRSQARRAPPPVSPTASFDFAIMNPPFNAATRPRDAGCAEAPGACDARRPVRALDPKRRGRRAAARRPRHDRAPGFDRPDPCRARRPLRQAPASCRSSRAPMAPRSASSCARCAPRAPALSLMPALVLHEASGSDLFSPHADAINNGRASLFGD